MKMTSPKKSVAKMQNTRNPIARYFEHGWNWPEFCAEFLGTFVLMMINNGVVAIFTLLKPVTTDILGMGYVAGIGAMIGIMVSLPISGGHINPAVTVAFALSKKLKWTKVPHYIIAQYFGSFFAQVVLFVMYFDGLEKFDNGIRSAYGSTTSTGKIFATFPPTGVTLLTCIGDQVIGTALLLIGICAIIDARGIKLPIYLQPFIISLWIAAMATALGYNSGAIMNPARDLAPRVFTVLAGYGWQSFTPLKGHYWYAVGVIAPHLGAILGVYIYEFLIGSVLEAKLEQEIHMESNQEDILDSNIIDTSGDSRDNIMNHFQIQVDPNRYLSRSLNSSSTSEHFVENNNNSEVKNKLKLSGANGNSRIITSHDSRQNRLEYEEQELSDAAISRSRSKSISYGDKIKDLSL